MRNYRLRPRRPPPCGGAVSLSGSASVERQVSRAANPLPWAVQQTPSQRRKAVRKTTAALPPKNRRLVWCVDLGRGLPAAQCDGTDGLVHAVLMIVEVLYCLAMHFPNRRRGRCKVCLFQLPPYCRATFVFQAMTHLIKPCLSRRFIFAIQSLSQFHQVLLIPPGTPWHGRNRECTPPWGKIA